MRGWQVLGSLFCACPGWHTQGTISGWTTWHWHFCRSKELNIGISEIQAPKIHLWTQATFNFGVLKGVCLTWHICWWEKDTHITVFRQRMVYWGERKVTLPGIQEQELDPAEHHGKWTGITSTLPSPWLLPMVSFTSRLHLLASSASSWFPLLHAFNVL